VDTPYVAAGKQVATLFLVVVAWVFFRAKSVPAAMLVLHSMMPGTMPSSGPLGISPTLYFWLLGGAAIALLAPNTQQLVRYSDKLTETLRLAPGSTMAALRSRQPTLPATPLTAILCGLLFAAAFAQLWRPQIFIYFNF
jgi:hypothetical protein